MLTRVARCARWSVFSLVIVTSSFSSAMAQTPPPAVDSNYRVGPSDVLTVTVWKHEDLSGEFTVDPGGSISLPLVGLVKVGGRITQEIETDITRLFADGFLRQPQVSVAVQAVRSKQVFVVGEVKLPGPLPLTGDLTVIEALTRAGALSETIGGEVIVLRRDAPDKSLGPTLPGSPDAKEVLRLDINALRAGRVNDNARLQSGDTVFVTRADVIFVHGQVNTPGAHPFEKGMTVLRALTLAGGAARLGATNRVRIRRLVNGRLADIRVNLTDLLQPGDEVFVPTRLI